MPIHRAAILLVILLPITPFLRAEPKPPKPEDLPKIVVACPIGVVLGAATKVSLRGQKLDSASAVRCQAPTAKVKLLGKGTAGDIPRVGNSHAEIELTLAAEFADKTITVTIVNAAGESNAHRLIVDKSPILTEKEPNNGFAQAQPIAIGQTAAGVIERGFDVDVYRFDGKAGQRIIAEVVAARFGSPLDSFLTLYTGDGQTVAANDDLDATTTDSRLEATLLRDGPYYLVLVDANDHGSAAHVYRLGLHAKP
jgi:pre-peptidase